VNKFKKIIACYKRQKYSNGKLGICLVPFKAIFSEENCFNEKMSNSTAKTLIPRLGLIPCNNTNPMAWLKIQLWKTVGPTYKFVQH